LKNRYFIKLSFKGTNYHGWQVQVNAKTVQSQLNKALSTLLGEDIETIGAGRTDTGVHAKEFYAHFDHVRSEINKDKEFFFRINRFLPKDISIQSIMKVNNKAHCRFDAISRTYEYHINKEKDPFNNEYTYYLYGNLAIRKMNEASIILYEYNDFTSFSKTKTDAKTNICNIIQAEWTEYNKKLIFIIKADRFLRGMVRSIVGTLLNIGFGKVSIDEFRKIIESKDRTNAGVTVPAHGLFLINIEYPDYLFLSL